ncbi:MULTISPECIES: DUF7311 family protein [Haloarcula]|uniref:DUF7311 family protein n=1 Tax=Haloarcula TaxID=2237 RepID=UPI0023E7FBDE|nr:hypothetical protein [Halomicroarcula sp. SHR3]
MIRVVVAVLLTVAIIGVSVPAIERGAMTNSEKIVEQQVSELSTASVSLVENEQVPPDGVRGPQRSVTLTFPDDSLTSVPLAKFRIERHSENFSILRYRLEGGTDQQTTIDAPIVNNEFENTSSLRGTGERDYRLELQRHNETAVVVLSRA